MTTQVNAPVRHHLDRRASQIADYLADGDPDELLTTHYVAEKAGVSRLWMELGRTRGYGPKWVRIGPRMVRYRRADVVQWFRSRPTCATTAEAR